MTAMTSGPALRERVDGRLAGMLADLEALVRCESPSSDRPSLVRCADLVAGAAADSSCR